MQHVEPSLALCRRRRVLLLLFLVELLDGLNLLLLLHSPILKPNFYLSFGETQHVRQFNSSPAREVPVEFKLLLQLERLVARVRLPATPPLVRVGTWKTAEVDTFKNYVTIVSS